MPGTHLYSRVIWSNVEWKNLPKVLTPQHRIQTRVLVVESPKLYPWAIALYINADMKVSEQCGIATVKENQMLGLIRRNIVDMEK